MNPLHFILDRAAVYYVWLCAAGTDEATDNNYWNNYN